MLLHQLGALRTALVLSALIIAFGAFFAGGGHYDPMSLAIIPRAVVPIFAVSLLFLLPLDMLMTRVFMSDKQGEERARFRRILAVEAGALALLVLCWTPFLLSLLNRR